MTADLNNIRVRITGQATFYCQPGIIFDPDELAQTLLTSWELPLNPEPDGHQRFVVAGEEVVLECADLYPETVEVLGQDLFNE
jgi:hypothetical protein